MLFCRQSVDFSLQCAWLLEAYSPASLEGLTKKNRSHGIKLKNLIMSGELIPKSANGESKKAITETVSNNKAPPHSHHNHRRTHIRSRSDASALISSSVRGKLLSHNNFKFAYLVWYSIFLLLLKLSFNSTFFFTGFVCFIEARAPTFLIC